MKGVMPISLILAAGTLARNVFSQEHVLVNGRAFDRAATVLADSHVRDLSPLSELKNLAYLEIFITPVMDYSPLLGYTTGYPTPIAKMTWLKNFWCNPANCMLYCRKQKREKDLFNE